jgi:hypothetical protein
MNMAEKDLVMSVETDYQSLPTCPFCGYKYEEWWDACSSQHFQHDGDETEFDCPECEKAYVCTLSVTYEFSTEPAKTAEEKAQEKRQREEEKRLWRLERVQKGDSYQPICTRCGRIPERWDRGRFFDPERREYKGIEFEWECECGTKTHARFSSHVAVLNTKID